MLIDQKTLKACKKGDRVAQRKLYDTYSPFMLSVARRYVKSIQEAEDVVQEALINVFKSLKTFKGDQKLDFWIRRIVINKALNSQRSKLYLFPMVDVEDHDFETAADLVLGSIHVQELYEIISELPVGCRVVFNLFAIEGYTHREIAGILEISEGTSKSQYARARKLLQEKLKKNNKVSYGTV